MTAFVLTFKPTRAHNVLTSDSLLKYWVKPKLNTNYRFISIARLHDATWCSTDLSQSAAFSMNDQHNIQTQKNLF